MDRPGVPPQCRLFDANRNRRLDAGEVRRPGGIGFRDDFDVEARNLAVPGETLASVFETVSPEDVAERVVRGDVNGREALKLRILGSDDAETVSQLTRARDLRPTFVIVWIGNNELLDLATETTPNLPVPIPADFGREYRRLLDTLAATGAAMAVANLPDPTAIALLRRAAPDVTTCWAGDGTVRPVAPDDRISIELDPAALPVPPCGSVLEAGERETIRATVAAYNAEIAAAAADVAARRGVGIVVVDVAAPFDRVAAEGLDLDADGVPDLTRDSLGGLFSLDGIHPTRTGHALLANEFIAASNARFGEAIRPLDVRRVARRDPLVGHRLRPAGEPPFGLIEENALEPLEVAFDGVESEADDLGDELGDVLDDLF